MNPEPAVVYLRVSTKTQQTSLDMQDSRCLDYCKYKGLVVQDGFVLREEAVSGSVPILDRKEGARMISIFEKKRAKHLVILKLDRLGRNAVDIQRTWMQLTDKLQVTIHVVDLGGDSISSDSPISKFIVGVLSLCAELERNTIRGRIKDSLNHKIDNGELCGSLPYGFTAVETGRTNVKRGVPIKRLVPHPTEFEWLLQIIEWREADQSFAWIAKELNAKGVPTKRGRKWSRVSVYNTAHNAVVERLGSRLSTNQAERTLERALELFNGDGLTCLPQPASAGISHDPATV